MQRVKSWLEVVSMVAVIAAAGFLSWSVYQRSQTEAVSAAPAVADVDVEIGPEFVRNVAGSGSVVVVEFTDFQCPFCARHATGTVPELRKALDGQARYVVVNLPLENHPQAIPAAEAAECAAEQGKYWEMHDALFARQSELAATNYGLVAAALGVDVGRFDACLQADAALARVKADVALAARLGVRATPTLFIGRMNSGGGVDLLKQINGAAPAETFIAEAVKVSKG